MLTSEKPLSGPEWSDAFCAAARRSTVVAGMTPEMVATVWGYPSVFGSRAEMAAFDTWTYVRPTPFGHAVHFRNGLVDSVTLPKNLP